MYKFLMCKVSNIIQHFCASRLKRSPWVLLLVAVSGSVNLVYASDSAHQTISEASPAWCSSAHAPGNNNAYRACLPDTQLRASNHAQTNSDLPLLLAQATTEQVQDTVVTAPETNTDLTPVTTEPDSNQTASDTGSTDITNLVSSARVFLRNLWGKVTNLSQGMLAALILGVTLPIVLLLALTTRFFESRQRAAYNEQDDEEYSEEYSEEYDAEYDRQYDDYPDSENQMHDEDPAYYQSTHEDDLHSDTPPASDTQDPDMLSGRLLEEENVATFDSPDDHSQGSRHPNNPDDEIRDSLDLIDELFSEDSVTTQSAAGSTSSARSVENRLDISQQASVNIGATRETSEYHDEYDSRAVSRTTDSIHDYTGEHSESAVNSFVNDMGRATDDAGYSEQPFDASDNLHDNFNQTYIEAVPAYHIDLPQKKIENNLAYARTEQIAKREKAIHSAHWLSREPAEMQKEYVIDYLVYWMAHADKRFAPAAEKKVLQMKNPGTRDLIKRDVFLNNAYAYSMVVNIIQKQMTLEQRVQILDLLMALLVVEHALTPIQNNLLRFLADAFGIGTDGMKRQFEVAYGYPMPAVPRPDKLIWWKQINNEHTLRWNARAIARLPMQVRNRILLGQSLDGEIRAASVIQSFRLAEDRCHPKRVDKLGKRAQALLKSRSQKFASAKDNLLETIA